MKKFAKQLTGLFLALVMVLSMSVSVFAAPNHSIGEKGNTDCSVKVTLAYYDVTFTDTSINKGAIHTDSVTVTVKDGTTVEEAVEKAMTSEDWLQIDSIVGKWVPVTDYYDSTIIHDALNSVTIDNKEYATVTRDTDTQWRGAGWTYTGTNGNTAFDTNKYMCDNVITEYKSTITLTYDTYEYNK